MKKISVGFHKKPQGVFTKELIEGIEQKLREFPNIEVHSGLDFTEGYVKNGHMFVGDFDMNTLDVYFWHDSVKPMEWGADNFFLNNLEALSNDCLVINSPQSTRIVNDKYKAHTVLASKGLPVADFALVHATNKEQLEKVFNEFGGSVLIKPRYGGWGVGIVKAESMDQLYSTVELLLSFLPNEHQQILIEKYYPNDISKWISVVVLGDKVLFGYAKGNLGNSDWKVYDPDKKDGKGTHSSYVRPSAELEKIALEAKKAIGKDIIGFDFILTEEGYKIVDENGRPGIYPQCIKQAGISIEDEIVNLILSKVNQR